jgi:hypothetical protein
MTEQKYKNKFSVLLPDGTIRKVERKDAVMSLYAPGTIIFDSEMELKFYTEILLPRIKKGLITVELQPKYILQESFEKFGKKHQAITYSPDFKVTKRDGEIICYDVKGFADQKFPIKRKLFDARYPDIRLVVMKRIVKFGGWLTDEQYMKAKREEKRGKSGLV